MVRKFFPVVTVSLAVVAGGLLSSSLGALPKDFIDSTNSIIDTLRKRECTLNITLRNQPLPATEISIKQLRNHFGFGASIAKKFFTKTDSASYGDAFRSYFDYATPENEMKWGYVEAADDYQDYQDADYLVNWCAQHNIKVRGHNLFWNEHEEWIPNWTKVLPEASFKTAMKMRIQSAMAQYKGKVAQWDLINEIVHGPAGEIVIPGMLATRSGDPDIFSWIFKEARAIDPDALLGVNEYGILTPQSAAKDYIGMIKKIEEQGGKIDIVGAEGHLGAYVERSSYLERIDTLAKALTQPIWLTEVDFAVGLDVRADKMEELMRTCFAHPRVGGLVLWIWWEGNRWRDVYTSFLVDSNYTENELGERWRTVRDGWKTTVAGRADDEGHFSFKGFHGQYVASYQVGDSSYNDTFYVEPGLGTQSINVDFNSAVGVHQRKFSVAKPVFIKINGKKISFDAPLVADRQMFISTYSLLGKLISRTPLLIKNGVRNAEYTLPSGCHIVHIGTGAVTYYSGKGIAVK